MREDLVVAASSRPISGIRLLGGVNAIGADGSVVDLSSRSQRRLIAVLALAAPRHLRGEWLAETMAVSPGALRTTVARVRAAIGVDVLLTSGNGYALDCWVDVARFGRAVADAVAAPDRCGALQAALGHWTGPPLEEFSGEPWAETEIARLGEIHAAAVDDLVQEWIEAHRPSEAIAQLESQLADNPYRDRSYGLLIRAYACGGRQADALRTFQRYRAMLGDNFGTEPSPDVVRIERRVASGWNGVETAETSEARSSELGGSRPAAIPFPNTLARPATFVGRVHDLQVLDDALARVDSDGLQCVTVLGEAGTGKTTLLGAFASRAHDAGAATIGYGRADEMGVSLQPFRTIFNAFVEHLPTALLQQHVTRCGGEIARISPSIVSRVHTAPPPTSSDDATERFLAFEAAADLVRRAAEHGPCVLILDDLQWAEASALTLVRHLVDVLIDAPVLVVAASRDPGDTASTEFRGARAALDRRGSKRIHLGGLEPDGSHGARDRSRAAEHPDEYGNRGESVAPTHGRQRALRTPAPQPLDRARLRCRRSSREPSRCRAEPGRRHR